VNQARRVGLVVGLPLLAALIGVVAFLLGTRGGEAIDEGPPFLADPAGSPAPADTAAPARPDPVPAPAAPAPAQTPAPSEEPSHDDLAHLPLGERLFEESRRWIANGSPSIDPLRDSHFSMDAKFELEGTRHEGPMRLWLQLPDLYRQETTMSNATTVKVLKAGNLWIRNQSGAFKHMNREGADGLQHVRQTQADLDRVRDLTKFVTLEDLKGPGVTFEFQGEKQPSGDYARPDGGTWAKVVRRSPGNPSIYFWLAHTKDAGGVMHATYPGVVRIEGIPIEGVPTEDFLLQDWTDPAPSHGRRPRRIRAFQARPGEPLLPFLQAQVYDIRLNAGIDARQFDPR
jgi:hypothetical protein